jgi:hypothetical protein
MRIEVKFSTYDKAKILSALGVVQTYTQYSARQAAPYSLAVGYKDLLRFNILSQKHMSNYPKYHPKYKKWKTLSGGGGFWYLFGDLVRGLSVFKTTGGFFSGIRHALKDQGGKSWFWEPGSKKGKRTPIALYGWVMEYGGSWDKAGTHPARPIFTPTFDEFVVVKAPLVCDQILSDIGKGWK